MTIQELDRLLAQLDVPETRYRIDMDLHDRSQRFSSELLKLAMAGIAVVGFFVASIPEEYRKRVFDNSLLHLLLIGAVVGFAAAVACALWHRFLAGGANFHHIQFIKLLMIKATNPDPLVEDTLGRKPADVLVKRPIIPGGRIYAKAARLRTETPYQAERDPETS